MAMTMPSGAAMSRVPGPNDELEPLRLILSQRREVEPVGDCAQPGPETQLSRRILHDLCVAGRDVDLLPVGERVLVEWMKRAELTGDGPLIDFSDRLFFRGRDRHSCPVGGHTVEHCIVDAGLRRAIVGIKRRHFTAMPASASTAPNSASESVDGATGRSWQASRIPARHHGQAPPTLVPA